MQTIQVKLDDSLFSQMKSAAEQRQCSVEQYVTTLLEQAAPIEGDLIGSMASDANLLDEVVEAAMLDRETLPLRAGG